VETGTAFEDRIRLPFARPAGQLEAAVRLLGTAWRGDAVDDVDDVAALVL
jgi:hypothetical protein